MAGSPGPEGLRLEALTPAGLPAFRDLLGGREFGGCFCAVWTAHDATWAARCGDPAQPNYRVTEARVRAGERVGYLVYRGPELVGWTGSGPKARFPFLASKLASRLTPSDAGTWAIGCIALAEGARGAGLAGRVVEAVVAAARAGGAGAVEAYPTRPWDEGRSFRGRESTYLRLGFREVGRERDGGSEVLLLRLELGGGAAAPDPGRD